MVLGLGSTLTAVKICCCGASGVCSGPALTALNGGTGMVCGIACGAGSHEMSMAPPSGAVVIHCARALRKLGCSRKELCQSKSEFVPTTGAGAFPAFPLCSALATIVLGVNIVAWLDAPVVGKLENAMLASTEGCCVIVEKTSVAGVLEKGTFQAASEKTLASETPAKGMLGTAAESAIPS